MAELKHYEGEPEDWTIRKIIQRVNMMPVISSGGSLVDKDGRPVGGGGGVTSAAVDAAKRILDAARTVPNGADLPLIAAPAWQANAALYGGSGSHVQNGGRLYWSPSGGASETLTSGAAFPSAPAQPWMPYIDNSIRWYDMGPVPPTAPAPAGTTPSSITYEAWAGGTPPANTTLYGGSNGLASYGGKASLLGGFWRETTMWGGAPGHFANTMPDGTGANSGAALVAFSTNAQTVWFNHEANFGRQSGGSFKVNGYWTSAYATFSPNEYLGRGGMTINFGATQERVFVMPVGTISGLRLPNGATCTPVASPFRLAIDGDSIMGGAGPQNGGINLYHQIAHRLGCIDVWGLAAGGTGFINAGGAGTMMTRIQRVINANPDYLYLGGFHNDVGDNATYNSLTRKAAYKAYVKALRTAGLVNTIIDFGGSYRSVDSPYNRGAASHYQVELDVISAVQELRNEGDGLVFYQRWLTSPILNTYPHMSNTTFANVRENPLGGIVCGSGHVDNATPAVAGNASWMVGHAGDGLHPNQRWIPWAARNIADHILRVCQSIVGGAAFDGFAE